ncbi:hypothetical protein NL676_026406 [Syzygium grande]|nr:hypothetical protein NL676_026406 [Syzygium grande]
MRMKCDHLVSFPVDKPCAHKRCRASSLVSIRHMPDARELDSHGPPEPMDPAVSFLDGDPFVGGREREEWGLARFKVTDEENEIRAYEMH